MAAAGAVVATANPVEAIAQQLLVPEELKKGLTDGTTIMQVSLVELVKGRRTPVRDHPTLDMVLHGNSATPGNGEELTSDELKWAATRAMTIDGIRIFGGNVGGRPYQNFAWFVAAPALMAGNTLTARYALSFNMDIMSEEHRDKPLRDLVDISERQTRENDRVNAHKPAAFGGFGR